MSPMHELGKMLFIFGILMVAVGLFLMFAPRIPFIGRLPGDMVIRRGNFTFYFPLATSLLLSVLLTLLFSIFRK